MSVPVLVNALLMAEAVQGKKPYPWSQGFQGARCSGSSLKVCKDSYTRFIPGSDMDLDYTGSLRETMHVNLCVPVTKRLCECMSILTGNLNTNLQKPGGQRTDLRSAGSVLKAFGSRASGTESTKLRGSLKPAGTSISSYTP